MSRWGDISQQRGALYIGKAIRLVRRTSVTGAFTLIRHDHPNAGRANGKASHVVYRDATATRCSAARKIDSALGIRYTSHRQDVAMGIPA